MGPVRTLVPALAVLLATTPLHAQTPAIATSEGTDLATGIHYLRLFLPAAASAAPQTLSVAAALPSPVQTGSLEGLDLTRPVLTAQCSAAPAGRQSFDLFVNFGGVTDTAFYPPWKTIHPDTPQPRKTIKTLLTMEFLGYTRIKPVRRQFEYVLAPAGQLHYNPATLTSSNLEDVTYWLQYLRALPTLRISDGPHSATFETAALLAVLHREPLCHSSGL